MPEQYENTLKTMAALSQDLDALGWDQPARIYHLTEDENDPIACLAGIMPTYPPDDMAAAYDAGFRVPPQVHGLLVASEGYRHLSIEEVMERNPLMRSQLMEKVHEEFPDIDEAKIDEAMGRYYNEQMMPRLPAPSQMPPFMRAEMRIISAVFRDGTTLSHGHTKDTDDGSGQVLPEDAVQCTNVAKAMYLFLNDLRPDLDCDDPKQRVADHQTLKFLADLPTTED